MRSYARILQPPIGGGARAFTLIELLAVFAIILVLISAILVGGPRLIGKARTRTTESLLRVVESAIEEFKREQTEKPTLVSAKQRAAAGAWVWYEKRYGKYPPDELEVFTSQGLPGSAPPPPNGSLALARASVLPTGEGEGYDEMTFYNGGGSKPETEHRDLAAMVLAIEMFSPKATMILDHIPASGRSRGAVNPTDGNPAQFLDRNADNLWTEDADTDPDVQIRYIVDAWGVPISYLAQRDFAPNAPAATVSSNHALWNQASTELIRLNGGRPVVMSFGPSGPEQFKPAAHVDAGNPASFIGDWADPDNPGIDNPLNKDNVYANPDLAEKLTKPAPEE